MMLMPMLLGVVLLAEPEATNGPRRDELDTEARIAVEADTVRIELLVTSRAKRPLRLTLPAGMSFRPIGRDAPVVLALEPATIELAPGGTQRLALPALPLAASDRIAGPAMADVTDALGPAIKLVATIHDLSRAGKLRSSPSTVARFALQLPPIGHGDVGQVRQEVPPELWREIQGSLAAAFPAGDSAPPEDSTVGSRHTLPTEHWYSHGQGHYRLRIPEGWTLVPGYRNREADKDFDTLRSPDRRYVIVCSRHARVVGEAGPALAAYRERQASEVQGFDRVQSAGFKLGGAPAIRIGYVVAKSGLAIWRMAVVQEKRRYVINAIAPAAEHGDELPPSIAQALDSLTFITER